MSDNGLDAELLGMVGDDSDEEGQMSSSDDSRGPSPAPRTDRAPEGIEDDVSNRKGVAQKVRARGRRKRKAESDDEDDFGDSPSPSLSQDLGSDAMAQSDSGIDAASNLDNDDGPLYPIEGKYTSASDRDRILSMPEIKREEILAERAQEVIKRQQDLQLRKALAAGSKQKRKADTADLGDSDRRTTRPKAEKGRSALDDYKRARELKTNNQGRLSSNRDRRGDRSVSSASDRDADGDSEVEYAEPVPERRKDEPPADLRDFSLCQVKRSNFAEYWCWPDFENALKGCYCRINIGPDERTGEPQYRIAQIRGFKEHAPYKLETSNRRMMTFDLYVTASRGNLQTSYPFSNCSNSKFTDAELRHYLATLERDGMRVPSRKYLVQKLDDINKFLNQQWTEQTLSTKLAKINAMKQKHDPSNAHQNKRNTILKQKMQAENDGDMEEIERCDAELTALDNSLNASNGTRPKAIARPSGIQERQAQLQKINQQNRMKNVQEVRRAQLEDRRKIQAARELARAQLKAKEEEAARKDQTASSNGLMAESNGNGISKVEASTTNGNGTKSGQNLTFGIRKKQSEDDLLKELADSIELDDDLII